MSKSSDGRIVWNHSTHLDGLIPILEKLVIYDGIKTVTPAVLSRSRSHSPHLKLKISIPIRGGYKLIARCGKSVQEVFIITTLGQTELEDIIASIL
ncbi:MAG: metal-binding protein [Cyanobacteria bacterium]|nr:metal-binding protein [Cyanobacteria bacterium CG_2015-16_32_12]NCO77532.1 metal-binding protein [Cyanobacteria bacterium CG_2015-22_32_23]NCQ04492.1 metal-binding protein [Cyanobacteria bacterium CG_2015-09_32_10]NCQ42838.1 metal-binding protein [Cyanobacteria bacterium CG_2015-04_32_10]NCS84308.1 metal-binding protein [Cyanobacteria bacterium CG_2015-02_32_10]